MRKLLITAILILIVGVPVFSGQAVFQLQATVDYTLTLTSTLPSISTIDSTGTFASLGKLDITSNLNGWTLTVKSSNGGKMLNGTDTAHPYPYQLTVGSVSNVFGGSYSEYVLTKTGAQPATSLTVTATYVTAASLSLPAGTYSDTLTITLTTL
jgi:hypothetical protein